MVKIKLAMYGRIKDPFYRIVAAPERSKRAGKPLDVLGFFNPKTKKVELNKVKLEEWVKKGAQITTGVKKIIKTK